MHVVKHTLDISTFKQNNISEGVIVQQYSPSVLDGFILSNFWSSKSEEAAKERYAYLNKLVTLYGNDAE